MRLAKLIAMSGFLSLAGATGALAQDVPEYISEQLSGAVDIVRTDTLDSCMDICMSTDGCRGAMMITEEPNAREGWCGLMPAGFDFDSFDPANRPPPELDIYEARDQINAYREQMGLGPVSLHPDLTRAARIHNADISATDNVAHTGADGRGPHERVEATGYDPRLSAENIAAGQWSLEEVIRAWQLSEGHNRNLLLPGATHMGIDLTYNPDSEYRTFWTLVLGASFDDLDGF